jgi:addiction module HigA family antidote
MKERQRKPVHPGQILEEHYIKPLNLNLQILADHLGIARNTLYKIRVGNASVTAAIAIKFAEAFNTTPELWLNLQQKYDLWCEANQHKHKKILPLFDPNDTNWDESPKAKNF